MIAIVVDASVWVSYFLKEDVHHPISRPWLTNQLENGIVVGPTILLGEVAGPVARETGDKALAHATHQKLMELPTLRIVPVDDRLGEAAAIAAVDFGLRAADAIYVALAQVLNIPLITWDRRQGERGAAAVLTSSPTL